MYSKMRAVRMTIKTNVMGGLGLGIFQDDMIDDVAGVARAVGNFLEQVEQVAGENDLHRILFFGIEIAEQFIENFVRLAFDGLKLVVEFFDILEVNTAAQFDDHLAHDLSRLIQEY